MFKSQSPRCSWCATARWQRTWNRGSRSTITRDDIFRTKTIFSPNQDWPVGSRFRPNSPKFWDLGFYILDWLYFPWFGNNFPDFSLVLILISLILYSSQISHQVLVMKETLVFITPPQPHIETIMQNVSETFPKAKNSKIFKFRTGMEDQVGRDSPVRQEYFKNEIWLRVLSWRFLWWEYIEESAKTDKVHFPRAV